MRSSKMSLALLSGGLLLTASFAASAADPETIYTCVSEPSPEPADGSATYGLMMFTMFDPQQDDLYSRVSLAFDQKVSAETGQPPRIDTQSVQSLVIDSRHLQRNDDRYYFSAPGRFVVFSPENLIAAEGATMASVSGLSDTDPAFTYSCEELSPGEDPMDVLNRQISVAQR